MAAEEQQRQGVVARRTGRRGGLDRVLLLPAVAGRLGAEVIGAAAAGDREKPGLGVAGATLGGPLGGRGQERFLDRILAGVEVAEAADQGTEHLRDQPPDLRPAVIGGTGAWSAGGAAGVGGVGRWAHMS